MPGFSNSASAGECTPIPAAARLLAAGGLVVYPTETLYALGADAHNAHALQRLVEVKGREPGKPIAVLISDMQMLEDLVAEIPPAAAALMHQFWPGPLTVVLRARPAVSPLLTGGGGIGIRLSSHPLATALVQALGRPITAPSANPAGRQPPACIEDARVYFGASVDAYIDGGRLAGEPASTVVDARGELRIIRAGAVAAEALAACLRDGV